MNNTSPIATPDATSRWDTMSDFTRIGVGLALGLSVMTFVVMCSMAGPMIRGATAWLRQLAWLPALTYQTVTTGYLACLYAAVVAVGVAHAQRTTTALAERRPKSSGKPHVGDGPFWTWGAVMAVSTVAGVLCGLISLGSPPEAVGALVFALVVGGLVPWLLLLVLFIMLHAEAQTTPTSTGMVQMMGLVPALVLTVMGFSAVNLGLLFGLWTMMVLFKRLESDELPATYSDSFETTATSASTAG